MSGRVMGVTCVVTVAGADADLLARDGLAQVSTLEDLWSRFRPDSDITRLNTAGGSPLWVDPRTLDLVAHMVAGVDATAGAFNPTLLPLQLAAGDDRSLVDGGVTAPLPDARPFDTMTNVIFHEDGRLELPEGMAIDAGGIGKGLAADIVVENLLSAGAHSCCVNIGGDMRVSGPTPDGLGWAVTVLDPRDLASPVARINVSSGGVATSALGSRRRGHIGPSTHVFADARHKVDGSVLGATVLASTAAWAEVWTKALLTVPVHEGLAAVETAGLAALLVGADGGLASTSTWKNFES